MIFSLCAAGSLAIFDARPVAAQSADEAFVEGRKLMDAGKFREACAKFFESYEAAKTAGKAFNLSVCEERQGHLVKALFWMRDGQSRLPAEDDRQPGATKRSSELESRIGHVTPTLEGEAEGAELLLDGEVVKIGASTQADPGSHVMTVRASGRVDTQTTFSVGEGEAKTVTVKIGPVATAETKTVVVQAPVPVDDSMPAQHVAGFVVGGIGLASLIGFATTAGLVAKTHSDFEEATGQERIDLSNQGENLKIAEGVLLGVGAAAATTGLILLLVPTGSKDDASDEKPAVQAFITPTAGYVGVSGRF
ncbi:MAG: hypothetical protein HOW73_05345 [Polyangiaceae bacterium]|nr:hypothetical protein [Polyangiaceae bacterium]